MTARPNTAFRSAMIAIILMLAAEAVVAQHQWSDVVKSAVRMDAVSGKAVASGEAAEGFAAFALDLDFTGPLTVEVLVTEVRTGIGYSDDDSRLWLFNEEGRLIAENDDSPLGGYASLINGFTLERPGRYYALVTTYPSRPEIDSDNQFVTLRDDGQSNIVFDLVVENTVREGPLYSESAADGPLYGDGSPTVLLDDFRNLATPIFYAGDEVIMDSTVDSGVALFSLRLEEPAAISAEVSVTNTLSGVGDSMVFLFDHEGSYVTEDDDGGVGAGSLISDIHLDQMGGYYIAVTSFPNFPVIDPWGYVAGFPELGENSFEFDLIVGPPRNHNYRLDDSPASPIPHPDNGVPASGISDVAETAQVISVVNGRGVGAGEVGTGYAAFRFEVEQPLYASIEVVVKDVRQGTVFADSDSVLSVFDSDGAWYGSDDDGGDDGASRIEGLYLDSPGVYYAIVTTYPNEPQTRAGFFTNVDTTGESSIAFDLVVRTDTAAR